MPDSSAFDAPTRFYAVWLSNRATSRRGTGWCWSPPLSSPREAGAIAKQMLAAGDATLAFVVSAKGAERQVMRIYPPTADGIIRHYLELLALLAEQP